MVRKSLFISFEGGDGGGKSTQARRLAETLRNSGFEVILTREPGGSEGAEEIRRLVLTGNSDRWSSETELLLFTAARRDHIEKTVLPALSKGMVVITDRFADSTRVYQGITRGDLRALVDQLHSLMIGIEPDLTIIIDVDPITGLRRASARAGIVEDRFESMGLDFQQTVRTEFLNIAKSYLDRCVVVSGEQSVEEVEASILHIVLSRLQSQ